QGMGWLTTEELVFDAEGRLRTPAHAAQALLEGARAVTVGSAITRVEHITSWFVQALSPPVPDAGA
ncbi:MAG: hypothetical protein NT071_12155, partial [Burkholderiales bacterium]|nr:hypothetical protein [Burkholderiales bacterium]